jgi:hypothetical protein
MLAPKKKSLLTRKKLDSFECAIIMDYDFIKGEACPHCNKIAGTVEIMDLTDSCEDAMDLFMGQVIQCLNCDLPTIVLQYPVIYSDEPIFLKWTIFEKLLKAGPSIMQKANEKLEFSSALGLPTI